MVINRGDTFFIKRCEGDVKGKGDLMDDSKKKFLKPKVKVFVSAVEKNQREWCYVYKIYSMCIADVRKQRIETIDEDFIKGPVRTFLVNWGSMGRVVGRDRNWCGKLCGKLKKHSDRLEKFRKKFLENENIENSQEGIMTIYSDIRKIVKPTSASKVLHLICPDFFPIWDENIRKKAAQAKGRNSGLNKEEKGYYEFMKVVKDFLGEYCKEINQLKGDSDKSKLHYVDQYLWSVANK
jgi:hypothetical protein